MIFKKYYMIEERFQLKRWTQIFRMKIKLGIEFRNEFVLFDGQFQIPTPLVLWGHDNGFT